MNIYECTVTSCLHLVRGETSSYLNPALGSGVIVQYKDRYFICTVEHFTRKENTKIGIITGRKKDGQTEIYELGEFSYIEHIEFEDVPDAEDLEYILKNGKAGRYFDIAFREIPLLENLVQDERIFNLNRIGEVKIERGAKSFLIVDQDFDIDKNELYSFYGRIRPNYQPGKLNFQEQLYWSLPIKSVSEHFIEFDLGEPIRDHDRFRGCSGAPVIDTQGRLVALITHGLSLDSTGVFGFRFDLVKKWIDLMYFQMEQENTGE